MIAFYWIFVVINPDAAVDDSIASQRYPAFQDINVMMLIGFGFLMTFIRSYAWSTLSYTFFVNAFVTQFYFLFFQFWNKLLYNEWGQKTMTFDIVTLITCSYCVGSMLITFGAVIGRVGPKDLIIIGIFHVLGYTLN